MNLKLLPAIGFAVLGGCAEPQMQFRGYTERSSCTEIIDAELAGGAAFVGGYSSPDEEHPGYVTELEGELFESPVRIEILCDPRGLISSVYYVALATAPEETGEIYHRYAEALTVQFGEPAPVQTATGRRMRFLCIEPSPILLDEWRLETEEGEDPAHEVYLAIAPPAAQCISVEGSFTLR